MLELILCSKENQQIIKNLCQLYYYDLDSHSKLANIYYHEGVYEQRAYFDNYWNEKNRFPYLIYKNAVPIGFALVHDISVNPTADWKLAEFFIMAPYKRQGIGSLVLKQLFQKHQGLWEISVLKDNTPAIKFWSKMLENHKQVIHPEFSNYVFFEIVK
ncbi:MAG: GNAT family N-acetyltransferase [Gammaproteobacteria bacterium]|nr:GNAT family N-acetyltransferase [Gammaproteobacteria bacterium]